jgi:hypothetical protein
MRPRKLEYRRQELTDGIVCLATTYDYTGDPKRYAKLCLMDFLPECLNPETTYKLVERWHHKVGRRWKLDTTILGQWKLRELLL